MNFDNLLCMGMWKQASLKSSNVTHSPCCGEIRIVSGVSIFNVFMVKNLLRALRSKIGRHLGFGFDNINSLLKKAREVQTLTLSTVFL